MRGDAGGERGGDVVLGLSTPILFARRRDQMNMV
jgi:hypothetical protein